MPQQMTLRHTDCKTVVEYTFKVLDVEMLLVFEIRAEKRRGRKLFGVAHHDDLLGACNRTHGFTCRHLRRLVENNQVEFIKVKIEKLRGGSGTHEHTRTSILHDGRNLREKLTESYAFYAVFLRAQ